MVPGRGVEPRTSGTTIQRSNHLSYPGRAEQDAHRIAFTWVQEIMRIR